MATHLIAAEQLSFVATPLFTEPHVHVERGAVASVAHQAGIQQSSLCHPLLSIHTMIVPAEDFDRQSIRGERREGEGLAELQNVLLSTSSLRVRAA